LTDFRKNTQTTNFMKIRPVGSELFRATDGRTDMTKLKVAFRNFANARKNCVTFRHIKSLRNRLMSNVRCDVTWWERTVFISAPLLSSCLYCITRLMVIQLFEDWS